MYMVFVFIKNWRNMNRFLGVILIVIFSIHSIHADQCCDTDLCCFTQPCAPVCCAQPCSQWRRLGAAALVALGAGIGIGYGVFHKSSNMKYSDPSRNSLPCSYTKDSNQSLSFHVFFNDVIEASATFDEPATVTIQPVIYSPDGCVYRGESTSFDSDSSYDVDYSSYGTDICICDPACGNYQVGVEIQFTTPPTNVGGELFVIVDSTRYGTTYSTTGVPLTLSSGILPSIDYLQMIVNFDYASNKCVKKPCDCFATE